MRSQAIESKRCRTHPASSFRIKVFVSGFLEQEQESVRLVQEQHFVQLQLVLAEALVVATVVLLHQRRVLEAALA